MAAEIRRNISDLDSLLYTLLLKCEARNGQRDVHLRFESVLTGYLQHLGEGEGVDEGVEGLHRGQRGGIFVQELEGCDLRTAGRGDRWERREGERE